MSGALVAAHEERDLREVQVLRAPVPQDGEGRKSQSRLHPQSQGQDDQVMKIRLQWVSQSVSQSSSARMK